MGWELAAGLIGQNIEQNTAREAGKPFAAAGGQALQSQTDLLNSAISALQQQYLPLVMSMLASPYGIPQAQLGQMQTGMQQATDREREQLGYNLGRRNITGPYAAALQEQVGERGLMGQYGALAHLAAGAPQRQEQALGGYLGQAERLAQPLGHMADVYARLAQGAAAPYSQAAAGIPGMLGSYWMSQAYRQPNTQYAPQPGAALPQPTEPAAEFLPDMATMPPWWMQAPGAGSYGNQ